MHVVHDDAGAEQRQLVAMGTMGYKHESIAGNGERTTATLNKTQVNLKLIPGVNGHAELCQLVAYNLTDIVVKGSWIGPGRLHLVPHVNAPVADFPVTQDHSGASFPRRSDAALWPRTLRLQQGRIAFWLRVLTETPPDSPYASDLPTGGAPRHRPFMESPHIGAWLKGS